MWAHALSCVDVAQERELRVTAERLKQEISSLHAHEEEKQKKLQREKQVAQRVLAEEERRRVAAEQGRQHDVAQERRLRELAECEKETAQQHLHRRIEEAEHLHRRVEEAEKALATLFSAQIHVSAPLLPATNAIAALEEADVFLLAQTGLDAVLALQPATDTLNAAFTAFDSASIMQQLRSSEAAVLAATFGLALNEAAPKRDSFRLQVAVQLRKAVPVGAQLLKQISEERNKLQPLCNADAGLDVDGDVTQSAVEEQRSLVLSLRRKSIDAVAAISKQFALMTELWASAAQNVSLAPQDALAAADVQLTDLKRKLQDANTDLQAGVILLQQRVQGAKSAMARHFVARSHQLAQLSPTVRETLDALQSDLGVLESVIAMGADKDKAVQAAKAALDLLEDKREDLDHLQKKAKRGQRTQDEVVKAEQAVSVARATYREAAHKLFQIAAAGYPEIWLGAVTRHQALLQNVPTISAAELFALGDPDDSNRLGGGAVSSVHRLSLVNGDVAFKMFAKGVGREEMLREANTLWGLRHPNIVQLLMVCIDEGNEGLVLERMDKSLYAVLHEEKKKLSIPTVLLYLCDVTAAVAYLHEHKTMHLDLKSPNVLLRGGVAKIANFGTTKAMRDTIHMTKVAFLPNWCAPEYLKDPQSPQPSADVWSLGMVLFEMCTGTVPYEAGSGMGAAEKQDQQHASQVIAQVLSNALPKLPSIDPQCVQWMAGCWKGPTERSTAQQLHESVKKALTRDCNMCCSSSFLLNRGGVACGAGKHFRCTGCLQDALEDALGEGHVLPDGALMCAECDRFGKGTLFAAEAFRDLIAPALWDRWYRASTEQNYKAGQQAERERRRQMSPVDRELDRIQRKLLNVACPHCDALFDYTGGCLALNCPAQGCGWKFCAYCFECMKESGPMHDHVAQCAFNPVRPEIFPPGQHNANTAAQKTYFDFVQCQRIKRVVGVHLHRLQPAELRESVKAKLASDMQRLNIVL